MVKPKVIIQDVAEVKKKNEQELLTDLLASYKKWMNKGEVEYAEAYRVLLNQFTTKE